MRRVIEARRARQGAIVGFVWRVLLVSLVLAVIAGIGALYYYYSL